MEYPTQSLAQVIESLNRLPGIGRKTAFRLALYLLRAPEAETRLLGQSILDLQANTQFCQVCGNLADGPQCGICLSPRRQRHLVCVVAEPQDLLAIERTGQYTGLYHVLGGVISPMDGRGPDQLRINSLLDRAHSGAVQEVILALSTQLEAEATAFYIAQQLAGSGIRITNLARGVPVGSELEFTDELTLGRSLLQRTPYTTANDADA